MSAITISRESGSWGNAIAAQVCDLLGYRLLDKQLIMEAAAEVGLSERDFVDITEQDYKEKGLRDHLVEMLFGTVVPPRPAASKISWGGLEANVDKDWFAALVNDTVLNVYAQGGVVIVGRGGQVILKDKPDVLHVRITAPLAVRVARVQREQVIVESEARQRIEEHDQTSARYLREMFEVEWDDPSLYHLIVNTAKLPPEAAASAIVTAANCLGVVPKR